MNRAGVELLDDGSSRDPLPSVRDLARHLRVSPNTVGRAYADLSRQGVIVAKAGGGSAVAPPELIDLPGLERTRQERLQVLRSAHGVTGGHNHPVITGSAGLEPGRKASAFVKATELTLGP